MPEGIKQKIYEHRRKEFEKRDKEHKSSGKWNASLLGRCKRLQYWKRKGEKPTNKPTMEGIGKMNEGRRQEDDLIQEMKDAGLVIDWEQEELEYRDVVGKIDCRLKDSDEIVEIKSQHSRSFWWGVKNGSMLKDTHKLQLALYMIAKKKKKGRVVYKSKDDGAMEEIPVTLTSEIKKEIDDIITTLEIYWNNNEVPKGEPEEEWECNSKWCNYYDKCKGKG